MDKISSIVPSSPRVTAVDLKESGPVRSGTPSFGRTVQPTGMKDKELSPDALKAAAIAHDKMVDARQKEAVSADIAKRMSDGFFGKSSRQSAIDSANDAATTARGMAPGNSAMASRAAKVASEIEETDVREGSRGIEEEIQMAPEVARRMPEPNELYPKGSFVNFQA